MAKRLLSNDRWAAVEPLLPPERAKPKGSRRAWPIGAALMGILLVLKTGMAWEHVPVGMGCRSGSSGLLRRPQLSVLWCPLAAAPALQAEATLTASRT
ncbi:transposase [Sabulicella rubraurantiaca]|uniref:transposase n=1 Tax=Sabulicella rubraurantiaca TaxID=2811429 RepID=UPI001A96D539